MTLRSLHVLMHVSLPAAFVGEVSVRIGRSVPFLLSAALWVGKAERAWRFKTERVCGCLPAGALDVISNEEDQALFIQ